MNNHLFHRFCLCVNGKYSICSADYSFFGPIQLFVLMRNSYNLYKANMVEDIHLNLSIYKEKKGIGNTLIKYYFVYGMLLAGISNKCQTRFRVFSVFKPLSRNCKIVKSVIVKN